MIQITPHISVDESDLEYSFVRASGPGGQNVNKVSSTVVLRFNVRHSSLPEDVKQRLTRLAGKRVTEDGDLILKGQQFRTQERNRQAVLERFIELVREASTPPKVRKVTKPTPASHQSRLDSKRHRKETKHLRRVATDID